MKYLRTLATLAVSLAAITLLTSCACSEKSSCPSSTSSCGTTACSK